MLSFMPRHLPGGVRPELPSVNVRGQELRVSGASSTWSENVVVDQAYVVPMDPHVPTDVTAVIGCAVTTGCGAVINTARVRPGDSVVVFGAGGVGLCAIQAAANVSAGPIIAVDVTEEKLEFARTFGATHGINGRSGSAVEQILDITNGGADFAFGASDFTIDGWVWVIPSGLTQWLYDSRPTATNGAYPSIYVATDNSLRYFTAGADKIVGSAGSVVGGWHHWAVARASGTTRLFLDGIQQGSDYADAAIYLNGASRPAFAADGFGPAANCLFGWLDELRVVNGSALWTANFSPPASATSSGTGIYSLPTLDVPDEGRLAPCLVQFSYVVTGQGASADFFNPGAPDNNDIFAHDDIFDSVLAKYVSGQPQVSVSADGATFGSYVKWVAGTYNMWKIKGRIVVACSNPTQIQAVLSVLRFSVYAPTRTDHPIVNGSISSTGTTITFAPDGGSAAAFNGGPNGGTTSPRTGVTVPAASVPSVQVTIAGAVSGDHVLSSALSLSQVTLQGKDNTNGNKTLTGSAQVWGF